MVFHEIRGNKLDDYILGINLCLDVVVTEGVEHKVNPTFEDWVTMDKLLLGWFYNTMSIEVVSQALGCKTS